MKENFFRNFGELEIEEGGFFVAFCTYYVIVISSFKTLETWQSLNRATRHGP